MGVGGQKFVKSLCSEGFEQGSDRAELTSRLAPLGFEPPTYTSAVGCITIRPLLVLVLLVLTIAILPTA